MSRYKCLRKNEDNHQQAVHYRGSWSSFHFQNPLWVGSPYTFHVLTFLVCFSTEFSSSIFLKISSTCSFHLVFGFPSSLCSTIDYTDYYIHFHVYLHPHLSFENVYCSFSLSIMVLVSALHNQCPDYRFSDFILAYHFSSEYF